MSFGMLLLSRPTWLQYSFWNVLKQLSVSHVSIWYQLLYYHQCHCAYAATVIHLLLALHIQDLS